jgi:hypothetical protein
MTKVTGWDSEAQAHSMVSNVNFDIGGGLYEYLV